MATSGTELINTGSVVGGTTAGGYGVSLNNGGSVYVSQSGVISGYVGVTSSAMATITNGGTISGKLAAVGLGDFAGNRLIVDPGAVFNGLVDGGIPLGQDLASTLEFAPGRGALSGIGTSIIHFTTLSLDLSAQWLMAGNADGLADGQVIQHFTTGDTIELTGLSESISDYSSGTLTLSGSQQLSLLLPGNFTKASFVATKVANGTDIALACFAQGTRIGTPEGDVAVEALRVGQCVTAHFAGAAPVVWIGHRKIDCSRHPHPSQVWPIRVATGAFGPGLPERALLLSPDHAVFVHDVLVPVKYLVNGGSIAQVPVGEVTYWHVELARHDVVLAEGLPSKSYLDTGDRANFANGDGTVALFADFAPRVREALGCAPFVVTGATLEAVRRMVARRELNPAPPASARSPARRSARPPSPPPALPGSDASQSIATNRRAVTPAAASEISQSSGGTMISGCSILARSPASSPTSGVLVTPPGTSTFEVTPVPFRSAASTAIAASAAALLAPYSR